MDSTPLVSVIMPFYNTPAGFMREAIESVLNQSHSNFELLLVDDGSAKASTQVAETYAGEHPSQVQLLEHQNHQNRGMSASRNLGIASAKGDYISFLDADDIWLASKLERQLKMLAKQPAAGMLYGNTVYWYSWTGEPKDQNRDFSPELGIESSSLISPPQLLSLFLSGKVAIPGICSILVRKEIFELVGGFEESFRGMYEDQVFYAKVLSNTPVLVFDECLEYYRQHPSSTVARSLSRGSDQLARRRYLNWLESYLVEQGISDQEVWVNLRKQLWLNRHYGRAEGSYRSNERDALVRWLKKRLIRVEDRLLPDSVSYRLWKTTPR